MGNGTSTGAAGKNLSQSTTLHQFLSAIDQSDCQGTDWQPDPQKENTAKTPCQSVLDALKDFFGIQSATDQLVQPNPSADLDVGLITQPRRFCTALLDRLWWRNKFRATNLIFAKSPAVGSLAFCRMRPAVRLSGFYSRSPSFFPGTSSLLISVRFYFFHTGKINYNLHMVARLWAGVGIQDERLPHPAIEGGGESR